MNLLEEKIIDSFTNRMTQELISNSRKGDWTKFKDKERILVEFDHHLEKLKNTEIKDEILEYSADLANIAMFMFNSVKDIKIDDSDNSDWISLDLKLPNDGDVILVWQENSIDPEMSRLHKAVYHTFFINKESFIELYPMTQKIMYSSKKDWVGNDSNGELSKLTHWMIAPSGPKK